MADSFSRFRIKSEAETFTPVHESGVKGPVLTLRSAQSVDYRKKRADGYRLASKVTDDAVAASMIAECIALIADWDIDEPCTDEAIVKLVAHADSVWIAAELSEYVFQKKLKQAISSEN